CAGPRADRPSPVELPAMARNAESTKRAISAAGAASVESRAVWPDRVRNLLPGHARKHRPVRQPLPPMVHARDRLIFESVATPPGTPPRVVDRGTATTQRRH